MRRNLLWWGLTILWCAFIFYMSARTGDESSMDSGFAAWVLNSAAALLTGREDIQIPFLLVRKAAHYTEYFILGFLLYKSFYNFSKSKAEFLRPAALGIFYAVTDEVHQYFVPGRAMQVYEVAIDSLGIFSAICILYHANKIKAWRGTSK